MEKIRKVNSSSFQLNEKLKKQKFCSLFESSQSLFWASFGMVGLESFELQGIKSYTRFWGLLMFGSYSVINVIVLLNLLIAMMSNSYATIDVIKFMSLRSILIEVNFNRNFSQCLTRSGNLLELSSGWATLKKVQLCLHRSMYYLPLSGLLVGLKRRRTTLYTEVQRR